MQRSLAARFGEDPKILTDADILAPIRPFRSLLTGSKFGRVGPVLSPEPPFINEKQAIEELQKQGMMAIESQNINPDIAGAGILPVDPSTVLKLAGRAAVAGKALEGAARFADRLAFGPVGTKISNVLSERFNKNPNWRPGFPGEKHLVLPTKSGLTRANFCGPGTNLMARLKRGDRGVSEVDTACSRHDMLYSLARNPKQIRLADNQLIRDIDAAQDISGAAGAIQKGILKAGLRAKKLGEDVGVFGAETFVDLPGLRSGVSPDPSGSGTTSFLSGKGSNAIHRGMGHSLESRCARNHHKMLSCSFVNQPRAQLGPFTRVCDIQGSGIVSNPQEATDLSHRKALDPNIANLGGRGHDIDSSFSRKTEPAASLRRAVMKDLNRQKRLRRRLLDKKGRGLTIAGSGLKIAGTGIHLSGTGVHLAGTGQAGGQLGFLASLASSFILPKLIGAIFGSKKKKQKGKGLIKDVFEILGRSFTKPIGDVFSGRIFKKGFKPTSILPRRLRKKRRGRGLTIAGAGPRDPTIANLNLDASSFGGRGKKKPGHDLGVQLLKKHGIPRSLKDLDKKLVKMGVTKTQLIPEITSMLRSPAFKAVLEHGMAGKGFTLAGGQAGGQLGFLASLASSFILPKIIGAIFPKKKKKRR